MTLPLVILTIVKDGMPWITSHWPELRRLTIPWTWHIVEGTSAAENCTSWCSQQPPGLSTDGTREYLTTLASSDSRIILHRSEYWHGKVAMVNAPLHYIYEPCILLQVDSDELWTSDQLTTLVKLFSKHSTRQCAYFYCRYFVGPDLVIATRPGFGNHEDYEWLRAWRFKPGMRFKSHEPPVLEGATQHPLTHADTERAGLIFDHMAWVTEPQVRFKCSFYGTRANKKGHLYTTALDGWHRLQAARTSAATKWPLLARDYLPFIEDDSLVEPV